MIQLNYKSGEPIYDQIVNGVIKLKLLGVLKPGDALPSVRSLALKLSVNPNTVQRAYQILEEKGVICSAKGKGSFISNNHDSEQAIRNIAIDDFKKAVSAALSKGLTLADLETVLKEENK